MAFDLSTAKEVQDPSTAGAAAATAPTSDPGLTPQDNGSASSVPAPSPSVSRETGNGGFDPKTAMPLDTDFSITHLSDKDMDIMHPTDMPDHELVNTVRDQVYANHPVPAVPEPGQMGFVQGLGNNLYAGYLKSMASIETILGGKNVGIINDLINKQTNFANFMTDQTKTADPYKQFGNHFAQGVGGLLSTLPLDIATGGATKGFLLTNVGARTAQILKYIPGFALGGALRGVVQGAEEGAPQGANKAVQMAAQEGTENLVWGTLYGNAGTGILSFPKMMALGGANATYEAAKQNRLPTTKELYTGVAEGLAYAAVFAPMGYIAGKSDRPEEQQALNDAATQAHAAADGGDLAKTDQVYQDTINNPKIRPELRDGLKQIYDQTRSENLDQVQQMTKTSAPDQEMASETGAETASQGEEKISSPETSKPEAPEPVTDQEKNVLDTEDALAKEPKGSMLDNESGQIELGQIPGVEKGAKAIQDAADFLKRSQEYTPKAQDLFDSLNQIKTQRKADEIRAVQLLKTMDAKPEDYAAIYKYADNLEVFGEPKDAKLTPDQEKIYKETLQPLQKANDEIFSKLRDLGFPIDKVGHLPREVEGKGGVLDRIRAGIKSYGQGSILNKSYGGFKKRVMNALTSESGNRVVASIKGGDVTAYQDGVGTDLGKLKLESYEDLKAKDLEPIDAQRKKLNDEYGTLTETAKRMKSSPQRIRNIEAELVDLDNQEKAVDEKYADKNMEDKVFTDKNGKIWKVGDATTEEIEANTNLTYHKNPVLNVLTGYLKMRQIERATDFLETLKASPDFKNIGVKFGTGEAVPDNWRSVDSPQFRGYAFEPRVADTLDSFYKKLKSGDDSAVHVLSSINGFLRSAIFFNPAIHIPNISVHWAVNRGVAKWFMPQEYIKLASTATRAIEAVTHQNADYVEMLDKGANLLYHDVAGDKVHDLMLKKMGEELNTNGPLRDNIAKALGYANPFKLVKAVYDFSGKATWSVNDIATMQAVYEEMDGGKTMEDAIKEVGKHIPNYRMPARILDSKLIGDIMSNPNLTMFGAYHYGALKSYGELIKSLVNVKADPKGSAIAIDKLAMAGLIGFVIYPALDNVAKALTGNQDASFRRAGATTFPYNTYQMLKGKMDFSTWLFSIATPAPLLKSSVELSLNRNLFTGKPVVNSRDTMLQDLAKYAKAQVSPVAAVEKVRSGSQSTKEAVLGLVGIKSPHHIAHTDAEQEAMNIMHTKNFGGPEMTDAQREKYQLKQSLSAGYAKTHDQTELNKYVDSGDITKRDKKEIIKNAGMSPIVRMTKSMSVEEVQKVFAQANPDEKKSLIPVLQKKIENRIKLVPSQQKEKWRQLKASLTAQ